MIKYFRDCCGTYSIHIKRNKSAVVWHSYNGMLRIKVGVYKNERGARIGLAKYCGGLPTEIKRG